MSHLGRIFTAYVALAVALIVVGFGSLEIWQRLVSFAAYTIATLCFVIPVRGDLK